MIYWLLEHNPGGDAAALEDNAGTFLSASERLVLCRLKIKKRRADWLGGRFTAKRAVQRFLAREFCRTVELRYIEILAGGDGAPRVNLLHWDGPAVPNMILSISHSRSTCFCALVIGENFVVGADIEYVEARSWRLAEDFFTSEEQAQIQKANDDQRDVLVTAVWSAKEAVLKACRVGLRADTRRISCQLGMPSENWQPFSLHPSPDPLAKHTTGWWLVKGPFVLTLAAKANANLRELAAAQPCMEALA
jgi:4'-phosphopantetheinyl transferase